MRDGGKLLGRENIVYVFGLWCHLDGVGLSDRFKVDAGYANDINTPKRLVNSGPCSIRDLRVADISLFKANTSKTELSSFRPDEVLDPEDTIAVVFKGDRPKSKCVHILVKFQESDPEETPCFREFYKQYWNKGEHAWDTICKSETISIPLFGDPEDGNPEDGEHELHPNVLKKPPKVEYKFEYIGFEPSLKGFFDGGDSILIREEYWKTLDHITKCRKDGEEALILTGQPGIGKFLFLYFALVYRVTHGLPTAFEVQPERV
ncbi:hypothetical protein EV426DRAFT_578500 [Tirmania nivea]|nr:hypothetical protein EV426DRAFT_578500 [Tirmania nivea]